MRLTPTSNSDIQASKASYVQVPRGVLEQAIEALVDALGKECLCTRQVAPVLQENAIKALREVAK